VLNYDVDEAHAVLEPEDLVGEAIWLSFGEFIEYCLDELLVVVCPIGLGLVADHGRFHVFSISTARSGRFNK
jgi:hypothetical protein